MAVSTSMTAWQRRWLFGANVALNTVLVILLTAILMWAADRYGGRLDLTYARVNSLSPRTVKLLQNLDQNVTVTGLYTTALKEIRPYAEKHQRYVADLLDLYETAGGARVSTRMIDPSKDQAAMRDLLERLRNKPTYQEQVKPYLDALEQLAQLHTDLIALLQDEQNQLQRLTQTDPGLGGIREMATIQRNLQVVLREIQNTEQEIEHLQAESVPRYARAIDAARDELTRVKQVLESHQSWMTREGARRGVSVETLAFFRNAPQRYEAILKRVGDFLNSTEDLKRPDLEEAYEQLKRGQNIVVETPEKIAVLSEDDVWPFRSDPDAPEPADGDPREFAGEQAISSAILRLTQKERTAVVFVRFGGQPLLRPDFSEFNPAMGQPPTAPYQVIRDLLEKEYFLTEEWDVKESTDPPTVEDAARTVYVVFPPAEKRQQNPMRPTPPSTMSPQQKQAVLDAVREAQTAIFMVGWMPSSPFSPRLYPYQDYLKDTWGLDVKPEYLAMHFVPNPDREGVWIPANRNPTVITDAGFELTDHPITAPLKSVPIGLQSATPVRLVAEDKRPQGVTIEPLIRVPPTEDVWAFRNTSRVQSDFDKNLGTHRYNDDIAAPFPLAVACTDAEGGRVVVFGSEQFAADNTVNAAQMMLIGGNLVLAKLFPGNTDLFINALHWLTGNANRIAVGPKRSDVPRLSRLTPAAAKACKVFLVGIWPALALLAGAVVWFVRRR